MAYDGGLGLAPALSNDSGAIVWHQPELFITVHVERTPASIIPKRALKALLTAPPTEIGGLLLGTVVLDGRTRKFLISEADFVTGDGMPPSTRLDFRLLMEAAKKAKPFGNIRPVGYFRSDLKDGSAVTEQDLTLMRQCFPDGECVALLLHPQSSGECIARFFLAENGSAPTPEERPNARAPIAEVAPTPSLKAPAAPPDKPAPVETSGIRSRPELPKAAERKSPEAAPLSPALVREPSASAAEPATPPIAPVTFTPQTLKIGALALGGAIVVGGLYLYTHARGSQPAVTGPVLLSPPAAATDSKAPTAGRSEVGLGLEVTRPMAGELDVKWNRGLLADATGGRMGIVDGTVRRTLPVDRVQLQEGRLAYFPQNTDVTFRLDVDLPDGRSVSESLRVVGFEVVHIHDSRPPAQAATAAPPKTDASKTEATKSPLLPAGGKKGTSAEAPPNAVSSNLHPASAPETPTTQPTSPVPEVPKTVSPELSKPTPALPAQPAAQVPSVAAPQPPSAVPPPLNQPATPDNNVPPIPSPRNYVEPKPLHQVMPDIRSVMQGGVPETVQVQVAVKVNRSGRVTDVHLRTPSNILTSACLTAARKWTFTPARLNDEKVESDFTITFVFQPQHNQN